jgi:hypothetical protein
MASATRRPTKAQAEMLALLRQGWLIRPQGYMVSPQGRVTGGISLATYKACSRNGWLKRLDDGRGSLTISETAP